MSKTGMRRWIESLAECARREAGIRGDAVAVAAVVAIRLMGDEAVCLGVAGSETGCIYGRLYVASDHPDVNHAVANTLALWLLETRATFVGTVAETASAAGMLGSAICATSHAVRLAYARSGEAGLHRMARHFGFSDTTMHLRLGEVTDDSRAVVTVHNRLITNDDAEWRTGAVPSLDIARGRSKMPGIRRAQLNDAHAVDRGSVVLRHTS